MTATLNRPAVGAVRPASCPPRPDRFSAITPNWFAAVMGTAIIAVAASSLPVPFTGLRVFARGMWLLAVAVLFAVSAATIVHWRRHPDTARRHHHHPVMSHFYGALPMALLSVGAATLLVGSDLIGVTTALRIDWALWTSGTVLGLGTAAAVPYLQFVRRQRNTDDGGAFGGWLMPVVPPMVSASTGALLAARLTGEARTTMIAGCYAMFGLSLLASVVVITMVWARLATHGPGEARMVPTMFIVLGPLGQSVTAAGLLGGVAATSMPTPFANAMHAFGVLYGLPVWGFAMLWAVIASAVVLRTARAGLPFSLTWWSFTFPVGTCVTGTSVLAKQTGLPVFDVAAVVLFGALVLAWSVVAVRTVCGVVDGTLLLPAGRFPILYGHDQPPS